METQLGTQGGSTTNRGGHGAQARALLRYSASRRCNNCSQLVRARPHDPRHVQLLHSMPIRTHEYHSTRMGMFFYVTVGRALSVPETPSDSNISAGVTKRVLELCSCSHVPPRLSQTRTSTPKVHAARQLQRWPPRAPKHCPLQPSWAACTVPSRSCRSRSHDRVLCAQMSARLSFPATGRGRAALASGARLGTNTFFVSLIGKFRCPNFATSMRFLTFDLD